MASANLLCSGAVAGAAGVRGDELVAVSVQGDGLSCYDVDSLRAVRSWALGAPELKFACPTVWSGREERLYAAFNPAAGAGGSAARGSQLLSWPFASEGGTIKQLAQQTNLPGPVHALLPLPDSPPEPEQAAAGPPEAEAAAQPGEGAAAAAAAAEAADEQAEAAPAQVEGSGQRQGAVVAVLASGAAVLCSAEGVLAEAAPEGAAGLQTLSASIEGDTVTVVLVDAQTGLPSRTKYTVQGDELQQGPLLLLDPPEGQGLRAVAAASTSRRTAVLWSDGSLRVYGQPWEISWQYDNTRPRDPATPSNLLGHLVATRLRGLRLPEPAGAPPRGSGGGRKRAHAAGGGAAAMAGAPVAVEVVDDNLVAVVGWSTEEAQGRTALRVVVLDMLYCCVQLAQDLSTEELGFAAADPETPVQAASLGRGTGLLAVCAGGGALLATVQLVQPTLLNLLGALQVQRVPAGGGSEDDYEALSRLNPCAVAASRALHQSELQRLAEPTGRPRKTEFYESEKVWEVDPDNPDNDLCFPLKLRCEDVLLPVLEEVEGGPRAALRDPGSPALASEAALTAVLQPLLEYCGQGGEVTQELVNRLALLAAGKGFWGAVGALLQAQHPRSLVALPGLPKALAAAHQYPLLQQLLVPKGGELMGPDLTDVLQQLLQPAGSKAAQQAYYEAAASAAEEAAAAAAAAQQVAERATAQLAAAGGGGVEAGGGGGEQQEPLSSSADGGGASDGGGEAQPSSSGGGSDPWQEAHAAAAVAACCQAAVTGFTPAQLCLHPLIAVPYDSGLLLNSLAGLEADEAIDLLRYLAVWLRNHAHVARGMPVAAAGRLPAAAVLPTQAQVLKWINCTIDANYVRLRLSQTEVEPVACELRELVNEQLGQAEPVRELKALLELAMSGKSLAPRAAAAGKEMYTVEWLDLRVDD